MKNCGYCGTPVPLQDSDYCSLWHAEMGAEQEKQRKATALFKAHHRKRDFDTIRVALKTLEKDEQLEAIAQMALEALDTLQRSEE